MAEPPSVPVVPSSATSAPPSSAPRVSSAPPSAPPSAGRPVAVRQAPSPAPPSRAASPLPFPTPEAAMRYLARAYNSGDEAALRSVTTPSAREALQEMRAEAVDLRLDRCQYQPAGDYRCDFTHDYPAALHKPRSAHGAATFTVGPAVKPGWYMTVLESCG